MILMIAHQAAAGAAADGSAGAYFRAAAEAAGAVALDASDAY